MERRYIFCTNSFCILKPEEQKINKICLEWCIAFAALKFNAIIPWLTRANKKRPLESVIDENGTKVSTMEAVDWSGAIQDRSFMRRNPVFWHPFPKLFKRLIATHGNNNYIPKKVNFRVHALHRGGHGPSVCWFFGECQCRISFHWKICQIGAHDKSKGTNPFFFTDILVIN